MPRRDGTGPIGNGSMTGRCMGYCVKAGVVDVGMGLGLGCRRGFRRWFGGNNDFCQIPNRTEKESLQEEKETLKNRLEAIEKQIESS